KNEKDKKSLNYKSKAGKDNGNSSKNNNDNRGLWLHRSSRTGQFNKVASPSPTSLISANTFYVTATNTERTSDASKQAYICHNQADIWLPLDEDDPTTIRLQHSFFLPNVCFVFSLIFLVFFFPSMLFSSNFFAFFLHMSIFLTNW
ncbi:hypothetical protein GQX74_009556, partial [Glossina fuscipes]